MSSLLPADVHLNGYLTQYGHGYRGTGTVGLSLCPRIPTQNQYGTFAIYPKDSWFRTPQPTTGNMGEAPKGQPLTMSNTSFSCQKFHTAVPFVYEMLDSSDPINLAERGVEQCIDRLTLDAEIRISKLAWSGVGSSMTAGQAWTSSLSSPCSHVAVARQGVIDATGYVPNTLLVPARTFSVLNQHKDITQHGVGNTAIERLASAFGIPNVLVPTCVANVANEAFVNSITSVWSTSVLVCYVPPNVGTNVPSFMYQMFWRGTKVSPGGPLGSISVQQTPHDEEQQWNVWARYYAQEIVVAPEMGFLIATGI